MEALDKIKEILGMVEVVEENTATPSELSEAKSWVMVKKSPRW